MIDSYTIGVPGDITPDLKKVTNLPKKSNKLDWDSYFMNIAKAVALRSSCSRRQVAAIIVKDRRIISTGYNGTPRGAVDCNEGGCPRCNTPKNKISSGAALNVCLCSHGEENAIVQAAYHGIKIKKSSLYTTLAPCLMCAKMIINAGIKEVVFCQPYNLNDDTFILLNKCKVSLRQFPDGCI
jgi:dCMP deaminase